MFVPNDSLEKGNMNVWVVGTQSKYARSIGIESSDYTSSDYYSKTVPEWGQKDSPRGNLYLDSTARIGAYIAPLHIPMLHLWSYYS
jgi:hypothetical protein